VENVNENIGKFPELINLEEFFLINYEAMIVEVRN
jgi:hypothetical protein